MIPEGLRRSVAGAPGGDVWLERLPALVARAADRWGLSLGAPFGDGSAAWAAPVTTADGLPAVLKISYPHDGARHEAAALRVWSGHGAVELLDSYGEDWALLLARLEPGTALRDADVPSVPVGARLLQQMASVGTPSGPFPDLVDVADGLAELLDERVRRLGPSAPLLLDGGLLKRAVDLLRTLPRDAPLRGLAHGDLNPGNILLSGSSQWVAIDPKAVVGDLAWDPWPLLTQVGDWTTVPAPAHELAERTRVLCDLTGLDRPRVAAWAVARGVESAMWAADRGWWTGFRGAEGDLARARRWDEAATLLRSG